MKVPYKGRDAVLFSAYALDEISTQKKRLNVGKNKDEVPTKLEKINKNLDTHVPSILKILKEELGADRIFLYEYGPSMKIECSYEYTKDGLGSQLNELGSITDDFSLPIAEKFQKDNLVFVSDALEYSKDYPKLHSIFKELKIRNFIAIQLLINGQPAGFIAIQNVKDEAFNPKYEKFIKNYGYFLEIALVNEKLQILSSRDALTGCMNRQSFSTFMNGLRGEGFAIISADLNNLKYINDTKGHNAGDEYIREGVNTLCEFFGPEQVFRFGGDEFICVIRMENESKLDDFLSKIRKRLEKNHVSMAVGGVFDLNPNSHLKEVLEEADRRMYIIKDIMHKEEGR